MIVYLYPCGVLVFNMLWNQCVRSQCQLRKCLLEHPSPTNFYVSCWQSSRSAAYLLFLRTFLFLYSTCVLLASIVVVPLTLNIHFGNWFLYVTHWGFLLVVLTTAFATAVSALAYFRLQIGMAFNFTFKLK